MPNETDEFTTSQVNLLQALTHRIKIALRNAHNYQRAVTDDLPGLLHPPGLRDGTRRRTGRGEGNPVGIEVAEFTEGQSKQDFINEADEALCRAKKRKTKW